MVVSGHDKEHRSFGEFELFNHIDSVPLWIARRCPTGVPHAHCMGVAGRHPHLQQRTPPGWPAGSAFAEQAAAQLHDVAHAQLPVAVLVQHAGQ